MRNLSLLFPFCAGFSLAKRSNPGPRKVLDPSACAVESLQLHQASFVEKWEGQRRCK